MSASCIILTSLAPSPMARVTFPSPSLMSRTTYAFCLGVTLQHTTDSQNCAIYTNSRLMRRSSMIMASVSPSTRKDFFRFCFMHRLNVSLLSRTHCRSASRLGSENLIMVISPYIRRHDFAMFSAVSILSPVSIHTLMLAFRRSAMVSGTSGCSLSSTAVAPSR